MELFSNLKNVICEYKGPKNENGAPHGYGVMEYSAKKNKHYKYEGMFVNGKRHGYGTWAVRYTVENKYKEWEWYQIGEYDSCGRFIRPKHEPGSYNRYVHGWNIVVRGWWKNDELVCDLTDEKVEVPDFEITHDSEFLRRFYDNRDIRRLSPQMVEKMRQSSDPYGVYGYGQWLFRMRPDGDRSLIEAQKCFKYAQENDVVDAIQMLSIMYANGEFYRCIEAGGEIMEMSATNALMYNDIAIKKGSEYARLVRNDDLFYGRVHLPADKEKAIAEAEQEAAVQGASLLWTEQLGWYYQAVGRLDDAIAAFEKCILSGLYYAIDFLACLYYEKGDTEYANVLMEQGVRMSVPGCMVYGIEKEAKWDELYLTQQVRINKRLTENLKKGIELGDGFCAYVLAYCLIYGKLGFRVDVVEGLRAAYRGVRLGNRCCRSFIVSLMEDFVGHMDSDEVDNDLPEDLQMTENELRMMRLNALRRGDDEMLDKVIADEDAYISMGYGEEISNVWRPRQKELKKNGEPALEPLPQFFTTPIEPTVMIIQPSGFTDFVEADVSEMSFRQMGELIDADGVDAVHFSAPLTKITKACALEKQVTMYVDRNAVAKGLPDNPVATMLYGNSYEIRGAVIIAMEDEKYDTYSFGTEEEMENVYDAIDDFTGGLLRRDWEQEDAHNDPWA